MNEMERMEGYFKGEKVDAIPFGLIDCEYPIANILGYTTEKYNSDIDVMTEVFKYKRDKLGFYEISMGPGGNLKVIGEALGSKLHYPENGYEFVEEFILDDFSKLDELKKISLREIDFIKDIIKNTKTLQESLPDMYVTTSLAGPITTAISLRPIEKLLKDTKKNKEKVHDLLEFILKVNREWLLLFKENFGSVDVAIADPVSCNDILSKSQFLEFSYPYLERTVEDIKEIMGVKPMLHICGPTNKIWEDLKKLDLGVFSVDNCEDIGETVKALGDKFTIAGNVDPVAKIRNAGKEELFKSVRTCLEKASCSENGYFLLSGCEIPLGTSEESMLNFIEAAKTLGSGAQLGKMPEGLKTKNPV